MLHHIICLVIPDASSYLYHNILYALTCGVKTHLKIKMPSLFSLFGKNLQRLFLYVIPWSPQSLIIIFLVGLATSGTFIEF